MSSGVMTAATFADKALEIATKYQTSYMLSPWGWPTTDQMITRALNTNNSYNNQLNRGWVSNANAIKGKGFMFDCVGLIKGILWGWNGDLSRIYGGAGYMINGVPDYGANQMISACSGVSTDFSAIVRGEIVWIDGHTGVYIGDGLVVEATPKWNCKVQISTCQNIRSSQISGTVGVRQWVKHSKLPWVDYSSLGSNGNIPGITTSSPAVPGQTSADPSNINPDGTLSVNPNPSYGLESSDSSNGDYDALMANPFVSYIVNISGTYGVVDALSGVDYSKLTPYVATLTRNTSSVSFSGLRQMKACAVMIEAGYLYDSAHNEAWSNNPRMRSQCQTASENNFPFGLYMTGKARSVEEAKQEMYYFSFSLRKFPPVLGAWVEINLPMSNAINDMIVQQYQKELERLGFKNKMGLYATDAQLARISWANIHSKDWLLWINRHVSTMIELGDQITPQFFVVT